MGAAALEEAALEQEMVPLPRAGGARAGGDAPSRATPWARPATRGRGPPLCAQAAAGCPSAPRGTPSTAAPRRGVGATGAKSRVGPELPPRPPRPAPPPRLQAARRRRQRRGGRRFGPRTSPWRPGPRLGAAPRRRARAPQKFRSRLLPGAKKEGGGRVTKEASRGV